MNENEKMLLVGSDSKWAIESNYVKALKNYYNVHFFSARGKFLNYYYKSILNKLLYRLGISSILKELNKELIALINREKYDIIFVFKGMELFPSTIEKLKSKGIFLINYNPDHPFEFFSRGSGNKNVSESIHLYNHHFSYSKQIVNELKNKFKVSASWLPFAYAVAEAPQIEAEQFNRLCFIGNPDNERAKEIMILVNNDLPIDLYGNNWERFISKKSNLNIYPAVYGENFIKIATSYRLQLNIFRSHNYESHNMRTFEMPAIGCLILAPRTSEQLDFFKEGEEAFYYSNSEEMVQQANKILSLEKAEAFELKCKAYHKCISKKHNYYNRAKLVHEFLQQRYN